MVFATRTHSGMKAKQLSLRPMNAPSREQRMLMRGIMIREYLRRPFTEWFRAISKTLVLLMMPNAAP